jgi:DNA polymerase-1
MKVICDIESNEIPSGNATYPDKIWCISACTLDGKKRWTWRQGEFEDFRKFASSVTLWVGHNFLNFDRHVLLSVLDVDIKVENVLDTLILSRLFLTERPKHSLDSWGETLGFPKIDFHSFHEFSEEMVTYCENDVELNRQVFHELMANSKGFSNQAVRLEHDTEEILNKIRLNGWYVDIEKIVALRDEVKGKLDDIHNNLHVLFPPRKRLDKEFKLKHNKDGSVCKLHQKYLADPTCELGKNGVYRTYIYQPFNPNSHVQKTEILEEAGWKPYLKTKSGKGYMICEENLATLPDDAPPSVRSLADMQMLKSRYEKLEEWLNTYNPNTGRIHGNIISIGAITHRMAHRNPQMGNITAVRHAYGREMRECWTCPPGKTIVGIDIAGIQLAVLAHYMNDPAYIKAIEEGDSALKTDIHNVNMQMCEGLIKTRDDAKTTIYALLLGGGDARIGLVNGGDAALGRQIKATLRQKIPGFGIIGEMCKRAARRGYMNAIDKRRIPIKSEHYALSSYLQGTEAIIMKQTLVLFNRYVQEKGIDCKILACVHDEIQVETTPEYAEEVGKLAVDCIREAGTIFNLNVKLDGEYNVGNNWAETH